MKKLLFDLFPVLLFFAAFKYGDANADAAAAMMASWTGGAPDPEQAPVMLAALVGIAASVVQIALVFLRGRRPEPMLWVSFVIVVLFGGLTIWLHDPLFVKWKPTILYWIFAAVLLIGRLRGRNLLRLVVGKGLEMEEALWDKMQNAWIGFFAVTGVVNLAVAYTCSTAAWVNFKLFGITGLTLLFTIGLGVWLTKASASDHNEA